MELEKLFDKTKSDNDKQKEIYILGLKDQWASALDGAKEVFENISFLKNKGYRVHISLDTLFDYDEANNGHFPNVRVNDTIMIRKRHDFNTIRVSGLGKFPLSGEQHTYESFIEKLIRPY